MAIDRPHVGTAFGRRDARFRLEAEYGKFIFTFYELPLLDDKTLIEVRFSGSLIPEATKLDQLEANLFEQNVRDVRYSRFGKNIYAISFILGSEVAVDDECLYLLKHAIRDWLLP